MDKKKKTEKQEEQINPTVNNGQYGFSTIRYFGREARSKGKNRGVARQKSQSI